MNSTMYSGSWFKTLMMFFREANKFQVTLGFKIHWLSLLLEKVTTIFDAQKMSVLYTCQLSRLRRESHACELKTSISRPLTPADQFLTPD